MRSRVHALAAMAGCCALMIGSAAPVLAQTPNDLRDLVGARAGQAESAVTERGYRNVRTTTGDDRKWSYWVRGRNCVQITTLDGRYDSIQSVSSNECQQAGRKDNGSDVAAAAIAGAAIIGVAALLHHKDNHKDGKHLSTGASEADYERGFNDGLYDQSFNNYTRAQAYADGFNAGVQERQTRASFNRHPDHRGSGYDAPPQGMRQCAIDASRAWDVPMERVVPSDSQSIGGGTYRVTVRAGYRTATCTVNRQGEVTSFN